MSISRGGISTLVVVGVLAAFAGCGSSKDPGLFHAAGAGGLAGEPGLGGQLGHVGGDGQDTGAPGVAGSSARGGAPEGGRSGSAGSLSSGGAGEIDGASGSGGVPVSDPECDDGDACTIDRLGEDGCESREVTCRARACWTSRCDPATGDCVEEPMPDDTPCDDRRACTVADVCQAGECRGTLTVFAERREVEQPIPDGSEQCHGATDRLSISFEVESELELGSVTVALDLEHRYFSEIEMRLRHEPSGRDVVLVDRAPTNGLRLDGVYTFADKATPFPVDLQYADLEPGTYAPVESFASTFADMSMAGTWTITVADHCDGDRGVLRAVELRLQALPCP